MHFFVTLCKIGSFKLACDRASSLACHGGNAVVFIHINWVEPPQIFWQETLSKNASLYELE
jgi:hypothetical protein